jgi:hypothetical protein
MTHLKKTTIFRSQDVKDIKMHNEQTIYRESVNNNRQVLKNILF